jgi:hypothetical protein
MARYVELVVHGGDRDLKGYLGGYLTASGTTRLVFADDAGFHIQHLRERIRHHGQVQHVIVQEADVARVRAALAAAEPGYRFEIKEERPLERAHFAFEFETPSRKVAGQLKALLSNLPAGARVEHYAPEEKSTGDAEGTELYTPEHDYSFKGRGEVLGPVFPVVDARAAILAIDFTRCDEILVDGV